jgi:hypothetical protein
MIHKSPACYVTYHVKRARCYHISACPQVSLEEEGLQMWKVKEAVPLHATKALGGEEV